MRLRVRPGPAPAFPVGTRAGTWLGKSLLSVASVQVAASSELTPESPEIWLWLLLFGKPGPP